MLVAGIGIVPSMIESVDPDMDPLKGYAEFRQKALELVGYKGIIGLGASLIILSILSFAGWKFFFDQRKEATREEKTAVWVSNALAVRMALLLEEFCRKEEQGCKDMQNAFIDASKTHAPFRLLSTAENRPLRKC